EGGRDQLANAILRAVVLQRRVTLDREHAAGEEAGEESDRERADADHVHLLNHLADVCGTAEEPPRGARREQGGLLNLKQSAQGEVHASSLKVSKIRRAGDTPTGGASRARPDCPDVDRAVRRSVRQPELS